MLLVDRARLRFVLRGRPQVLPLDQRCKVGHLYSLGVRRGHPVCRVRVTSVDGDQMTVELAAEAPPRLLAKHSEHGYVDDTVRAMAREPEAVTEDEQRRISDQARTERRARVARGKTAILDEIDRLADGATAQERRQLRNVRRAASAL